MRQQRGAKAGGFVFILRRLREREGCSRSASQEINQKVAKRGNNVATNVCTVGKKGNPQQEQK